MLRQIKKILFISLIYVFGFNNAFSMQADIFVQSTVNRASKILGDNIPKNKKIEE